MNISGNSNFYGTIDLNSSYITSSDDVVKIGDGINDIIKMYTQVGINATPLSNFDVNGGVAIGSYAGANSAPTNGLINSGYVGIGTRTPEAGLEVSTTGTAGSAIIVPRDTSANRPSSPVNGIIRYNTTNANFEGYADSAWSSLGSKIIYKSATQSVSNNTTVVDDSELKFTLNANEKWKFEFEIFFDNNTGTADNLKIDLNGPASPTNLIWKGSIPIDGTNTTSMVSATSPGSIVIKGIAENGANSGTYSIKFAQSSSNACLFPVNFLFEVTSSLQALLMGTTSQTGISNRFCKMHPMWREYPNRRSH